MLGDEVHEYFGGDHVAEHEENPLDEQHDLVPDVEFVVH